MIASQSFSYIGFDDISLESELKKKTGLGRNFMMTLDFVCGGERDYNNRFDHLIPFLSVFLSQLSTTAEFLIGGHHFLFFSGFGFSCVKKLNKIKLH